LRKLSSKNISRAAKNASSNGAVLGFEEKLWKAADKLRNNMDATEYKHVVLGLIFLKYISDFFEVHQELVNDPEKSRRSRIFKTSNKLMARINTLPSKNKRVFSSNSNQKTSFYDSRNE